MRKKRITLIFSIICIAAIMVMACTACTACDFSQFFGGSTPKHYIIDIEKIDDNTNASVVANNSMEKAVRIETRFLNNTASIGSGFLISKDGYILTNAHCVDAPAGSSKKNIQVTFVDGENFNDVKVIASDAVKDIAVLKIEQFNGGEFQFFEFASLEVDEITKVREKENLKYGEMCFTIGNPSDVNFLFTSAMVSSPEILLSLGGNKSQQSIALDASINHGNSGGVLINKKSQAVGMINARVESPTGINNVYGIGLAIPRAVIFDYLDSISVQYSIATVIVD